MEEWEFPSVSWPCLSGTEAPGGCVDALSTLVQVLRMTLPVQSVTCQFSKPGGVFPAPFWAHTFPDNIIAIAPSACVSRALSLSRSLRVSRSLFLSLSLAHALSCCMCVELCIRTETKASIGSDNAVWLIFSAALCSRQRYQVCCVHDEIPRCPFPLVVVFLFPSHMLFVRLFASIEKGGDCEADWTMAVELCEPTFVSTGGFYQWLPDAFFAVLCFLLSGMSGSLTCSLIAAVGG